MSALLGDQLSHDDYGVKRILIVGGTAGHSSSRVQLETGKVLPMADPWLFLCPVGPSLSNCWSNSIVLTSELRSNRTTGRAALSG